MIRHKLAHGEIVHARVEEVYPTVADGSVTLCHVDGPYNLGKAKWDRIKDLAAWYRPHIAEWGRICAPSASVYLWNTAEGWAAIHPEMVAAGWTFRALVTWDKGHTPAQLGHAQAASWADVTEVAGFYVRGTPSFRCESHDTNLWRALPNAWLDERIRSEETFIRKAGCAPERVPLHPCQKPLLFARRIVEASSRPGDLVFEPFGGTCRIAAACEAIGRYEPEKARRYVCVEMDEDGRGYIPAVLAALRGEIPRGKGAEQGRLFGPNPPSPEREPR